LLSDNVVDELLRFIHDIMTVDDTVNVSSHHYSVEEVKKSRVILLQFVNQKKLLKQKGQDKDICTRTVTLIVKAGLDPSVKVPRFCAVNLSRLPPVDTEHIDVSAILSELSALTREVRTIAQLQDEPSSLKALMNAQNGRRR